MEFYFTKHAKEKFARLRAIGFSITKKQINNTIEYPERDEKRLDGTIIAMRGIDQTHVLRVVYRKEMRRIVIITFYPGRRKAYGLPLRS